MMQGEFIGVWPELWKELWLPLIEEHEIANDIFCELYRELAPALKIQLRPEELADVIDNPVQAEETFKRTKSVDLANERATVSFLESAHSTLEDFGGDELSNAYFNLLVAFTSKYSLRYDLRRPCIFCPTIQGVFANLVRDLRSVTRQDAHLDALMKDFENAIRDLRHDNSETRIKTCIQKQVNLIEAIGRGFPGVTKNTLGKICHQINAWPHNQVKESILNLYAFSCDYPGIRHGGTVTSALRNIDMRDVIAISILLVGFTPYLESRLIASDVFGGGIQPSGPPVNIPGNTSLVVPPRRSRISNLIGAIRAPLSRFRFWVA